MRLMYLTLGLIVFGIAYAITATAAKRAELAKSRDKQIDKTRHVCHGHHHCCHANN